MTISASPTALQSLQESDEISMQEVRPTVQSPLGSTGVWLRRVVGIVTAFAAVDMETWAPEQGWSFLGQSQYGGRYATQYMWWDTVSGFGANATYEHDFFLNNYDGKTYLDPRETGIRFPRVLYAASNLPRPYLDTRDGDTRSELAYTIGSADADAISANTSFWYYNYMRTENGNTPTDSGKLQAQLGHRSPSWCYSVWCSFGDQREVLVPAWQIPAPGSKNWRK